jgi:phosphoribosylformylglycinamidine (FGAM) synthase-like amidotransferase family enzyme
MPHPDRASDERLGSGDGRTIFESMIQSIEALRAQAA